MNKGDTLYIILDYTINGVPIEEMGLDEIEFIIGRKSFKLSEDEITVDEATGKYAVAIGQADTFALGGTSDFQVRFKKDGEVTSTDVDTIRLGKTLSKEVI